MNPVQKRGKRHISVHWKLFWTLMTFTVLLLFSVWLVNIRLLDFFYEKEKSAEMKVVAADIYENLDADQLSEAVEDIGRNNLISIRLFRVLPEGMEEIATADPVHISFIHPMNDEVIGSLYDSAKEGGGSYTQKLEFAESGQNGNGEFRFPGFRHPDCVENMIYAELFSENGQEYFLLLEAELMPVSSTVNTLQDQFLWLSCAMLFLTGLLVLALSGIIAKPLKSLTLKAGQLANGNYTADFSGKGYREVEELSNALNFAATEIGKADALQKELISNVSHDLRTPLTMIRGYSEMMRDIPEENTPENAQVIIDETTRLSELVSNLLDLSRLHTGTVTPELSEFDLSDALRDALSHYEVLIRRKGYRIEYRIPEEPVMVKADRTMILQVLYNLMNNAVNYTGEDLLVTVTEEIYPDRVRISVRDTGEGIPPELIPQIWDRYYRVDKVHKRAVMGTGLGLSIVKELLEKHSALYGVESAVGVGSVFWFELPLLKNSGKITGDLQKS